MFLNSNFYLYSLKGGKDMKGMNFKKAFLLSGILLLSVFVVIQLSWACDDDDKWDCDYHDKWHCDHDCWTCNPPKIERVYLYYEDKSIVFEILGKNFSKGGFPVVTLGGMYELNVEKEDFSDTHIIATLPLKDLKEEFKYGDYRLVVSTCRDSSCEYTYCKDYCFKCKEKHCREYCSKCKDRYCKHKYCKDHEYKCRCKDRYSLTIADPSGTGTCPPGTLVTVIVTGGVFNYNPDTATFSGIASCVGEGMVGYMVTGGGFSGVGEQQYAKVLASKPSQDGTGWELVILGPADLPNPQPPTGLTVWAVCAKVQ